MQELQQEIGEEDHGFAHKSDQQKGAEDNRWAGNGEDTQAYKQWMQEVYNELRTAGNLATCQQKLGIKFEAITARKEEKGRSEGTQRAAGCCGNTAHGQQQALAATQWHSSRGEAALTTHAVAVAAANGEQQALAAEQWHASNDAAALATHARAVPDANDEQEANILY